MHSAMWSPGRRPASWRRRLNWLAAASSSAKVCTAPVEAMISAGLSGVVAANVPGNMSPERSRRYVLVMDPTAIKARFSALLQRADADLPLDELCYLICRLAGYDVDIDAALADLDRSAQRLTPTFDGVMTGLFKGPTALRGNASDYYNLRNSMISEVQRTRLGLPITLSVLAMEHGRRINVPIEGIGLPGHFLVGAGDGVTFGDPFNGGDILDRAGVEALYRRVTGQRAWSDIFLEPVGSRDILFRVLNNIRAVCERRFADRHNVPWVLELLSWFPQGAPFDPVAAAKAVAVFN